MVQALCGSNGYKEVGRCAWFEGSVARRTRRVSERIRVWKWVARGIDLLQGLATGTNHPAIYNFHHANGAQAGSVLSRRVSNSHSMGKVIHISSLATALEIHWQPIDFGASQKIPW